MPAKKAGKSVAKKGAKKAAKKAAKTAAKKAAKKASAKPRAQKSLEVVTRTTTVKPKPKRSATLEQIPPDITGRVAALESQFQELTRQFIELRAMVARGETEKGQLDCQKVLQTARQISNKVLKPLDELRKALNPAKSDNIDKRLRECLTELLAEEKLQLQEMRSDFQVQIRTDVFGGFKA